MPVPRPIRTALFWTHLAIGLTAGVIILIMSVTGTLLAFEREIIRWADGYIITPPPSAQRLPVETLVARAKAVAPGTPTMVTMPADPAQPAMVRYGRERTVFVDPYRGTVLGEGARRTRAFFHAVTDWHRWLAAHGESRPQGKLATGVANLLFLGLVLSGIVLWWPRRWTRAAVTAVAVPSLGLRGKARDFNWHNSLGLWFAPVLFFIVVSAVFISFRWPGQWLDRAFGTARTETASRAGGANAARVPGGDRSRRAEGRRGTAGEPARGGTAAGPGGAPPPGLPLPAGTLDALWGQAAREPGWRSITARMPGAETRTVQFTIDRGTVGRPTQRVRIEMDSLGGVVERQTYASMTTSRRIQSWARTVHTGQAGGWIGQLLAMLASLAGAVLMWTGFALSWRRCRAWLARRAANPLVRIPGRVAREQPVDEADVVREEDPEPEAQRA